MEKIFFRVYIYISSSFELPGRCSFFSSLILRRGQAVLLLELPGEGARAGERQQIGQRGDGRRIVVQNIAGVVQFLCADVLGGAKAGFLKKQCGQMIGRKIDQLGQFSRYSYPTSAGQLPGHQHDAGQLSSQADCKQLSIFLHQPRHRTYDTSQHYEFIGFFVFGTNYAYCAWQQPWRRS